MAFVIDVPGHKLLSLKFLSSFLTLFYRSTKCYSWTSGFWPRVRARAPLFLSSNANRALRSPSPRPTQLRCFSFDAQKYIKSIELGPPTSKAFFFPLDHMQTEEAIKCEVPRTRPADPSSNILGSKLRTGATIRPNFFGFSFFWFWIFLFLFSAFSYLLFILFLFISSYSSLLISSYSSCRYYSSSSYSSLLIF
jgi:hypothetical protein